MPIIKFYDKDCGNIRYYKNCIDKYFNNEKNYINKLLNEKNINKYFKDKYDGFDNIKFEFYVMIYYLKSSKIYNINESISISILNTVHIQDIKQYIKLIDEKKCEIFKENIIWNILNEKKTFKYIILNLN